MSFTIAQIKENITAMGHSGSLNKVRNFEALCERAANTMIAKVKLTEMIRVASLTQTVHDNLFDYSLPSDYNSIIDLYPQNRQSNDKSQRNFLENFDLKKELTNRRITIEGKDGTKVLRISWKIRSPKTLDAMDSITANGTWAIVGTATNLKTDTIIKYSGSGSVRFDVVATGDGIQATDIDQLDLTDEDETADIVIPVYLSSVSNITSITPIWGNDLTANYWTGVAQTAQADGTSFKTGWNIIKIPWATATETGTVNPATIDAFKLTVQATGAISDIRVDNIQFSIGFPFDIKYYGKYLFKTSAGAYSARPVDDDSTVICDSDSIQIFLLELLKAMAHQLEGSESAFDISYAESELKILYAPYKAENPNQSKKAITSYNGKPKFRK